MHTCKSYKYSDGQTCRDMWWKYEGDNMCSLFERIFSVRDFKRSDGVRTVQNDFWNKAWCTKLSLQRGNNAFWTRVLNN